MDHAVQRSLRLQGTGRGSERTQREIKLIEEYRTTLMATAVTGKIDVRQVHYTR